MSQNNWNNIPEKKNSSQTCSDPLSRYIGRDRQPKGRNASESSNMPVSGHYRLQEQEILRREQLDNARRKEKQERKAGTEVAYKREETEAMPVSSPNDAREMIERHNREMEKISAEAPSASAQEHQPDPYHDELEHVHSMTIGRRGPAVLEDTVLHEEMEGFVHTKRIERAVHTKGFGAQGYFTPYQSMAEYTKLSFLQVPNQRTPVAVRCSLAVSTKGTPDTSRNVRGFSTKFYADEGIFDLLCNHIPVFSVRDAIRFPESIKAFLPSPVNNLTDPNRFWDFVARAPESLHFVAWLYSDVGTVKSLRKIRAYSVNTFVWRNAAGRKRYIKYHWLPLAGEESIDRQEAGELAGSNPDICGQDLYQTIAAGKPVEYELCIQAMDPNDGDKLSYDPLDCTKIWDEKQYPLIRVGKMTLDQNPTNYAEQIEKLAFSPSNLLEGAEFSDDKMLQGRSTIYWDAQRRRLGPDFRKIKVNRQPGWMPDKLVSSGLGDHVAGEQVRAEIPRQDNFAQAGEYYQSLDATGKDHLVDNIASDIYGVTDSSRSTVLNYFAQASQEFGERVTERVSYYQNQEK